MVKRTLILTRHAHADNGFKGDDKLKPLTNEGQAAVRQIAAKLHGVRPQLTLCSAARRTMQTAKILIDKGVISEIHYDDALYLATAGELLHAVQSLDDEVQTALIVAHNPGIHQLVLSLVGRGVPAFRHSIALDYPPSATSVLSLELSHWADISPHSAQLDALHLPH